MREALAMEWNCLLSESVFRAEPSAVLAGTLTEALLIGEARPYVSSLGDVAVALYPSSTKSMANFPQSRLS